MTETLQARRQGGKGHARVNGHSASRTPSSVYCVTTPQLREITPDANGDDRRRRRFASLARRSTRKRARTHLPGALPSTARYTVALASSRDATSTVPLASTMRKLATRSRPLPAKQRRGRPRPAGTCP
jgi:hypothetical protein